MVEAKLPPHPTRRIGISLMCMGGASIAASPQISGTAMEAFACCFGALFLWMGARIVREGPVVQRMSLALDQLNRGHLAEAEAMLDSIPPRGRANQLRRGIEVQRTMLALRRRDSKGAIAHATRAIEGRASLLSISEERLQMVSAQSLRAMAEAGIDDVTGALADVAAVRASPLATPEILAQASLAEAVTLSRANDREKLAALLKRDRKLLLEFTTPRDRTLVRALQRTLYGSPSSAYREAAPAETPTESDVTDWMSHVAPATAGLQMHGGAAAASPTAERVEEPVPLTAQRATESIQKRGKRFGAHVALLWSMLIVVFLGIWQFLNGHAASQPASVPAPEAVVPISPWALGALYVVITLVLVGFMRHGLRRLPAASRLLALEDSEPAERAFTALAKNRAPGIAAQADSHLALIATRRARFADALAFTERGIARIARLVAGTEILLPGLIGQRAWLLAALDRTDDARHELATLVAKWPTYPWLVGAQLTTHTVIALRSGDLAAASAFAARRTPDMPLSLQNELLADVLAANAEPRPAKAEVARLHEELRADQELRGWLHAVWPGGERALEEAAARAA